MEKIKLFDNVILIQDYHENNVEPENKTLYKKNSTGTVIEFFDDENVSLVEFSSQQYEQNIVFIPTKLLKLDIE